MGKKDLFCAFEGTLMLMSQDCTPGLHVLRPQVCEKPGDPQPACFVTLSTCFHWGSIRPWLE